MSVLALPTTSSRRQRPVSAPAIDFEASSVTTTSETSSPVELQPLLNRDALLTAWPRRSALVVEEIVVTEKNYVESLHEVVMGYLKPLYGFLFSVAEGPNFLETVFSNIMRLQQINMELFNKLLQHYASPRDFGNVFVDFVDHFMQYTDYCVNFPYAEELLQKTLKNDPETREFIMDCQLQLGHALPLITYLHKPVQRILKYRLLLEEVLKSYPQDVDGHQEIKCALETMSKVAIQINERSRQMENRRRVENIQKSVRVKHKQWSRADLLSYGNLITEECCKVLGRRGGERQLLLFEKTVLFLSKKGADQYKYKNHIMVEELDLSEVTNSPTAFKIFSHYSTSKHFTVQVRNSRVKEELICKFRSVLESHLEEETNSLQQQEDEKEPEVECSSMEDISSFGDSDHSLSETKIVARQRSRAFKSKELQWRKRREQTSTRKILDRPSSEGEATEDHYAKLVSSFSDESLSSTPLLYKEDNTPEQEDRENEAEKTEEDNSLQKEQEDDRPRPKKVIKLQRRSAVRYKRGSLGRAMTFAAQGSVRQSGHQKWSMDIVEDNEEEESMSRSLTLSLGSSEGEGIEADVESSTGVLCSQSSLDKGLRSGALSRSSHLVRQSQVEESPNDHSLSVGKEFGDKKLYPEMNRQGQFPTNQSHGSSWLCPVLEEAPSVELEDDEEEGEDEEAGEEHGGHDDGLIVGSSLRTDLRLKLTQERLEELTKGSVAPFATLPRKRSGDDSSKSNIPQKGFDKQHSFSILDLSDTAPVEKPVKETKPPLPTLKEDKVASSLPARGMVLSRISMYENLSKICADNQATYNSIPQLKSRRPFSMKVNGHAVPSNLLQRTKKTAMARTVYTSNPTQVLARESKAASNLVPQETHISPFRDACVTENTKSAHQTGTADAFDVPSPSSSAAESMQYDSGVASDTNSPINAPSSPSVKQTTLSSPTSGLKERAEHLKIIPPPTAKEEKQTHIAHECPPPEVTIPPPKMPGLLSAKVKLVGRDLPLNKDESCKKQLSLGVDSMKMAQQACPLQTFPGPTVSPSSPAFPGNGTIAGKPDTVGSTQNSTPFTQEAVASSEYVSSNVETTPGPSGLRERIPTTRLAPSDKTSSIPTHPINSSMGSSSTGVKSQRSLFSTTLHSQVMMGLLILAVCIFFFIMTLPYHTFGKNFFVN